MDARLKQYRQGLAHKLDVEFLHRRESERTHPHLAHLSDEKLYYRRLYYAQFMT